MANFDNIPPEKLSHEHYRQMLVRDGQRRYDEWHGEFIRYQKEFLKDHENRVREIEGVRDDIREYNKRRTREAHQEFLRYQNQYLDETRRY